MTDIGITTIDIRAWARERGLHEADPNKQFLKVAEEFGEIASAMARGNKEELIDAIGDTYVTLTILAMQSGTSIEDCIKGAYDVIKQRTGRTINGIFIKDEAQNV